MHIPLIGDELLSDRVIRLCVWVWLMGALKCAVVLGIVYSVVYVVSAVVLNIPYALIMPVVTHGTINIVNSAIDLAFSFIIFVPIYILITHALSK